MVDQTQGRGTPGEARRDMRGENIDEATQDYQSQPGFNAREDAADRDRMARDEGGVSRLIGDADQKGSEIVGVVHNTVSNTLRTVGAVGDEALMVTRDVVKDAIAATEDVGVNLVGGVTHLAKDLVHGVTDVGSDVGVVVRDGANGAVNIIGDVGTSTVNTLTDLLTGVVGGIRQVAGAAVGGMKGVIGESMPGASYRTEQRMAEDTSYEQPPPREQRQPATTSSANI